MTLTAPSGSRSRSADPPPPARRRSLKRQVRRSSPERELLHWLYLLVVVLTVFQRFVLPGTVISISLPATFLVLGVLVLKGLVVADVQRTTWYCVSVAACALATLLATTWFGLSISMNSLMLLAVLYIPCCVRVHDSLRVCFPRVLEFFQRLMVPLAAVCVGQWAAQMAGWAFTDLLSFVPPNLMFSMVEYNLSYPLYYGSSIYKSNGIIFNEPSFASQFLALAIIVQILRGGGRWRIALFGAALITTMAGTGLILLAVGIVAVAVRRGGRWAARTGLVLALTFAVVSLTPAGELLAERGDETAQSGSSGNIRFVAPYEQVWSAVSADGLAMAIGRGAGSVFRDGAFFNPNGVEVNYPVIPKLIGEYGLPATLLFVTFLLVLFLGKAPSRTLGLMAVTIHFVLSGALLQPQTVYLCWIITGLFAAPAGVAMAPRTIRADVMHRGTARRAVRSEPPALPSALPAARLAPPPVAWIPRPTAAPTCAPPSAAPPADPLPAAPAPTQPPADVPAAAVVPPPAMAPAAQPLPAAPSRRPSPRPRPRAAVSVEADTVIVEPVRPAAPDLAPAAATPEPEAPVAVDAEILLVEPVRPAAATPEPEAPVAVDAETVIVEPRPEAAVAVVDAETVIVEPIRPAAPDLAPAAATPEPEALEPQAEADQVVEREHRTAS